MPGRSPDAQARITRARHLASTRPQAAEPLTFYADLVELQQTILSAHAHVIRDAAAFADAIDFEAAADALPELLRKVATIGPAPLARVAGDVLREGHGHWRHMLHTYWSGERDEDPLGAFLAEALLQPFAESIARQVGLRPDPPASAEASAGKPTNPRMCPVCGDKPIVAVLHDAAHGAKRSVVCGFCLTEWAVPRIRCLACGEEDFDKLPVYHADEFAGTRVDACESCRAYVKTSDLTKDGRAVPVVDDVATVALDLWAREQGFTRLRTNLLRL